MDGGELIIFDFFGFKAKFCWLRFGETNFLKIHVPQAYSPKIQSINSLIFFPTKLRKC